MVVVMAWYGRSGVVVVRARIMRLGAESCAGVVSLFVCHNISGDQS